MQEKKKKKKGKLSAVETRSKQLLHNNSRVLCFVCSHSNKKQQTAPSFLSFMCSPADPKKKKTRKIKY